MATIKRDAWTQERADAVKAAFYDFLDHVWVNSKEKGWILLGENLYGAQQRVIEEVFDGLANGIHDFKILKSRQLGVSTIIRALMLFWAGVFDGLTGSLVFDTGQHLDEARHEMVNMLERLPEDFEFPREKSNNRYSLQIDNQSRINLSSAGVKESKSSGTLGRGSAVSLVHRSELCSYANVAGLEAFRASMARTNPNRLFVDESTARGFNIWHEIWTAALKDHHCRCIFVGWWAHPDQIIPRDDPDFEKYGIFPPSKDESIKIEAVKLQYGEIISPEQLAWIRREMDPTAEMEGDADVVFEGDALRKQEQPWTAEEAFQQTGSVFFQAETLTHQSNKFASNKFQTYAFTPGLEFTNMRAVKAGNMKSVELKVWEEPVEDSYYIVSADVAYGHDENNDRSAIQVLRCFSDGLDQVAEYAWPLINTRQFAWVIAALEGWYAGDKSQVYRIVEINGPGEATWNELQSLKRQIGTGYFGTQLADRGLQNIQRNVRNYMYTRSDSSHPGRAMMWKCLALDEPLPTPTGWTTMGDVQAGDRLFDENGKPCRVVHHTGEMIGHKCYCLTFDDGSTIVSDEDHLWEVEGRHILRTTDLLIGRHTIAVTGALDIPEADLPIDPYVLGVWLGDGHSCDGRYSVHGDDRDEMNRNLEAAGAVIGHGRQHDASEAWYQNIKELYKPLREAGLLKNKHIPASYLRGSFQQRLSLLQGLMDTDGTAGTQSPGQVSFTTSNPDLSEGFKELLRSLGIKPKFCVRNRTLRHKGEMRTCKTAYQFWFTSYQDKPCFRLARKRERLNQAGNGVAFGRTRRHAIVSVSEVPSVPVKCIQVDSPSHLYLAGRGMIPTHNSTTQLKVAIMERLRDFASNNILRIRSLETLDEMRTVAREGDAINAQGTAKDDRVVSLAMGVRCWDERVRRELLRLKRTREADTARRRLDIRDQVKMFNDNMITTFLGSKSALRRSMIAQSRRQAWRGR